MRKSLIVILAVAPLAACTSTSGVGRAMSYPASYTTVAMSDDTYRVFEHRTDKTLMTAPSIGKSTAIGVAKGATLGLASTASMSPEQRHRAAAQQYLAQSGRANCRITGGHLVLEPQYEFTYECAGVDGGG
ncbi:hypothetical protein IB277_06655 [Ensifer sp. ENS07]|uniref:hypothetical protein n=1 Tax=Ensifer sp. ENS07 TaxID=2769274 RepID=UPI00199E0AE7|nr:hypothetical protein [Ensifer sp. ENS07]MBD9635974.1 hypothetical protein [Ensifer sp. ENS07]